MKRVSVWLDDEDIKVVAKLAARLSGKPSGALRTLLAMGIEAYTKEGAIGVGDSAGAVPTDGGSCPEGGNCWACRYTAICVRCSIEVLPGANR